MISGAPQHMESTLEYVKSQLTLTFGRVRVGEVVLSSWTKRRGKESADWTNSWNSSGPQMQELRAFLFPGYENDTCTCTYGHRGAHEVRNSLFDRTWAIVPSCPASRRSSLPSLRVGINVIIGSDKPCGGVKRKQMGHTGKPAGHGDGLTCLVSPCATPHSRSRTEALCHIIDRLCNPPSPKNIVGMHDARVTAGVD